MPKTLLIMRHAKSSWANSEMTDHQRPLNKRGRRDAPVMGEYLAERDLVPDLIVLSSAMRTTQTAELLVGTFAKFGDEPKTRATDMLYHAPWETYLELASRMPNELETVLLLGHNPGIEAFVEWVSGKYEVMPTAAVAHFVAKSDSWDDSYVEDNWSLQSVWRPKEI